MRATITRRVRFAAARRIWSEALDEAGNQRHFGRDADLHGHDFTLEVTLGGQVPPATGMVMDLKALSALLRSEVTVPLDRTRLDGHEFLAGRPATTENLAVAIWRRIEPRLAPGALIEVMLMVGDGLKVRYRGE